MHKNKFTSDRRTPSGYPWHHRTAGDNRLHRRGPSMTWWRSFEAWRTGEGLCRRPGASCPGRIIVNYRFICLSKHSKSTRTTLVYSDIWSLNITKNCSRRCHRAHQRFVARNQSMPCFNVENVQNLKNNLSIW